MAKKSMQVRYKKQKRERNKIKYELDEKNGFKSFGISLISVLAFIGILYLGVLGMEKLGVFQSGYTKPTKEATEISDEYIVIGTVFNRPEKEYLVLFDDYDENIYPYINTLAENNKLRTYKVDMSKGENAKYKSDDANANAKKDNELKINDVTLIKVKNGKVSKYIVGEDNIEEFLK